MSIPSPLVAAFGFVALLASATPASAALEAACRWPPPGGTTRFPASTDVMATPVVGDLDADGVPEIVIVTFEDALDINSGQDGVLRILRGDDCSEIAAVRDLGCIECFGDTTCRTLDERADAGALCPGCGVAIADLDADGLMEILALAEGRDTGEGQRVVIFDHEGNVLRCTEAAARPIGFIVPPAVADLDADGVPEVVAREKVFSSDGPLLWSTEVGGFGPSLVEDLDLDGSPEVVIGERAHRADGSLYWSRPDLRYSFPAIGDFTADCMPEVVLTATDAAEVHVLDGRTGATIASAALPGGLTTCPLPAPDQGGPPTLADIDGDCVPEIGVAGCRQYAMYRFDAGPPATLTLSWSADINDMSSRFTGSTIFDLEGDGSFEVLYNDHDFLRVFDAATGAVLEEEPNRTATLIEYPTVADVDGDGDAEIVSVANDYFFGSNIGLTVFHDPDRAWAPTRPLMNQHTYHVTNVLDDGTIPLVEDANWARLNDYRVQVAPTGCRRDDCAEPPACDGGGPYEAECVGACPGGGIEIVLEAAAPDGDDAGHRFEWRIEDCCPEAAACPPQPLVGRRVTTCLPIECGECTVELTVTDAAGRQSTCEALVAARDAVPPSLLGVPGDSRSRCEAPPAPAVTAEDDCAGEVPVTFEEERRDGPCPHSYTLLRTWSATDRCGNVASETRTVEVFDDRPPVLVGVPANSRSRCEAPPAPAVTAEDDCAGEVPVAFEEERRDGPCPHSYTLLRTWSATDHCGNVASETRTVEVFDDRPPVLVGVPADSRSRCEAPPAPAVTAEDDCAGEVPVAFEQERRDGPCPHSYTLLRTWSATDRCGNVVTETRTVEVFDDEPPSIEPPPPDRIVDCHAVPEPYTPAVTDTCDASPAVVFEEDRIDQGCPFAYDLVRTWTATDACGNESSVARTIGVRDVVPPDLVVPPPLVIECVGPEGVPSDDPRILAWLARARAVDDCSGVVPVESFPPDSFPLGCPDSIVTPVTFRAVDECGNETTATSTVEVVDTTAPVIESIDLPGCLWSPNHRYWCVEDLAARVTVSDACSVAPSVFVEGCASDQPDEAPIDGDRGGREQGNGDGHHVDDCVVAPDGSALCLRIERQGTDPEGRHYSFTIVAEDACGNRAEQPWGIHVPHDQREHPCRRVPNETQLLPHEPFPWE